MDIDEYTKKMDSSEQKLSDVVKQISDLQDIRENLVNEKRNLEKEVKNFMLHHEEIKKYIGLHPRDKIGIYLSYLEEFDDGHPSEHFLRHLMENGSDTYLEKAKDFYIFEKVDEETHLWDILHEEMSIIFKEGFEDFRRFLGCAEINDFITKPQHALFVTDTIYIPDVMEFQKYTLVHPILAKHYLEKNLLKPWKN